MKELPDRSTLSHPEKDALIHALWEMVQSLTATVDARSAEVAELKGRLAKDSNKSRKPPSSDGLRKPKSLRKASGKKRGGQNGHPGSTLRQVAKPDHVVDHAPPGICDQCGLALAMGPLWKHGRSWNCRPWPLRCLLPVRRDRRAGTGSSMPAYSCHSCETL